MKLEQQVIMKMLGTDFPGQVTVKQQVRSTQELAKGTNSQRPHAFLADEQTKGHGKYHRTFYSPNGSGLYLSVLLPNVSITEMNQAGLFTTALANTVAEILERYYPDKHLGVKWVNDILMDGAKVCGILVEAELQGAQLNWIVGVGINLSTTNFPKDLDRKVGCLDDQHEIDRNQLAAELIQNIYQLKSSYQDGHFIADYQKRLILMNKLVTLQLANGQCEGMVQGIDQQGKLLVKMADGQLRRFSDGEVIKVHY